MVILTNPDGTEERAIEEYAVDIDINDTRDFVLEIPTKYFDNKYTNRSRIFIPNTEYGGVLGGKKIITTGDAVTIKGMTWRGYLAKHLIKPDPGEDYKTVSGKLGDIISNLIDEEGLDSLFHFDYSEIDVDVESYRFKKYINLLYGINDICSAYGQRLDLIYQQGEHGEPGKVNIKTIPIRDYSPVIEVSQDSSLKLTFEEKTDGVNHLVCFGSDNLIVNLYVQEDGSIGTVQYFYGLDEIAETLDCTNISNIDEIYSTGANKLKEIMSYKAMRADVDIESLEIQIGDIIGGRDYITGAILSQPITNKIYREENGIANTEYKIAGEDVLDTNTATLHVHADEGYLVRAYLRKALNNIFPQRPTVTYVYLDGTDFVYRPFRTAMVSKNCPPPIPGHKYYGRVDQYVPQGTTFPDGRFEIWLTDEQGKGLLTFADFKDVPADSQWHTSSKIVSIPELATQRGNSWVVRSFIVDSNNATKRRNHIIVDLTEAFGEGREPSLEWCDINIPYFINNTYVEKSVNCIWNGNYYLCYINEYGNWTIRAIKDESLLTANIVIDKPKEYEITL